MKPATKFTFDTVFADGESHASGAAVARRKRMISQGEIEELCTAARAEGMKAGEVRAQEAIAQSIRALSGAVHEALMQATEEVEALRSEAAHLAFALGKKLAHAALGCFPAEEVEGALREAMHQAIGEPRVLLRAAPEVAEALKPKLSAVAHEEGFEGRVQVAGEPHFSGADCRIEWRGGGAERIQTAIEKALEDILARRFGAGAQTVVED
jgi:flagellar assembly protein FliH